jgi:pSer/pThr/pTyr-binding forkhead associated (FHA) protein
MEFEIGIVCARCDRYSAMGTAECTECGNALALFSRAEVVAPPPHVAKPAPAPAAPAGRAPPPAPVARAAAGMPASVPRPSSAQNVAPASPRAAPGSGGEAGPTPSETFIARAAYNTEPPPSSILRTGDLVPRRAGVGTARSGLASGTDSAVSSPPSSRPPLALPLAAPTPPSLDLQVLAAAANLTLEELMEQAKNFVCRSCSTPVPVGHKFCGRCGAAVPPEILGARTQFFGQLQAPGKAKLILIRGEGVEGLSYQLNAEQHLVGRNGQLVFPDDPFVSPKHANLFYRNGVLVVRDEGSHNGVFVRVKGTIEVASGDQFLAGEQLFKLDANPKANDGPAPDGTYFYSSPKHQSLFRITQVLHGGNPGMVVCARGQSLQIGREGGDLNFPGDLYMSASHCRIEELSGKFTLTDLNSRNGTYIRLKAERELAHGDYLFIGRKLLRVEITAA